MSALWIHPKRALLAVHLAACCQAVTFAQDLHWVEQAATPGDDVVLGVDRDHLLLLSHPGEAPADWSGSETRMARLEASPWQVAIPEVWGHVPQVEKGWTETGEILHLDIDPEYGMAVLSTLLEGRGQLWLSSQTGKGPDRWNPPWRVPALEAFSGDCAFAAFDVHPDRAGDILVALRPRMQGDPEQLMPDAGEWKGGYDVARIPRSGGYRQVWLLDGLNSAADERALIPGPEGGGWLSTERLEGAGGLDPWWSPSIPSGSPDMLGEAVKLNGHTLEARCGDRVLEGLVWQVFNAGGSPLARLETDDKGRIDLGILSMEARYDFELVGVPPEGCDEAVAYWRDESGRILGRYAIEGEGWNLSMLTVLPLDGWRKSRPDGSALPGLDAVRVDREHRGVPADLDWVIFHSIGQKALSKRDRNHLRALAHQLRSRPGDVVYIVGHASIDGNRDANAVLAAERARHVAAQLEFAGLSSAQIRFEGRGDELPMEHCPPGVNCPDGPLERSRRTELHIEIGGRSHGGPMQ